MKPKTDRFTGALLLPVAGWLLNIDKNSGDRQNLQ
jgi:hypothetical protein